MTDMRRVTFAIPDELDRRILELKKKDPRFERANYSDVVRAVLTRGLDATSAASRPTA